MTNDSPYLRAALSYAAKGWAVLPLHSVSAGGRCTCGKADCSSAGKHPRTARGLHDATTDTVIVRKHWRRWPDANVGIATGERSGIFVVDIDPRNGGSKTWTRLLRQGDLPPTVRVATGGGGRHHYFAYAGPDVRSGGGRLGAGVDVKADGGYVVAPPSRHASGGVYSWKDGRDPESVKVAKCPTWLLTAIAEASAQADSGGARDAGQVAQGERNSKLASLAGTMRRKGMTPDAIKAALLAENQARCSPPLPNSEVVRIATSVSRYDPAAKSRGKIISRRLSTVKGEKVEWLWKNRIPLGKVTMLSGDPGLGKSFMTLDMAARVSCGHEWPDGASMRHSGRVLLLSAEDDAGDTIRPRLEAMGATLRRIHVIDGVRLSGKGEAAHFSLERDIVALERELKRHRRVRLVVIDPITAYLGGTTDSHKNSDVRALLAPLSRLAAKHRVAVVCVSHLNKGAGSKAIYRTAGSLAFVAAARAAWLVAADQEDRERRLFLPMKNNLAPEGTGLAYRLRDGKVEWEDRPVLQSADDVLALNTEGEPASEREDARAWLASALKDGPVPAKEVFSQGKEMGYSASTIKRVKRLLNIKPHRVGGAGKAGHWEWSLPAQDGR